MATSYNCPQEVAVLVCFAGRNQRIVINPKKCNINKDNGTFTYLARFVASDGITYRVQISSIPNQDKGFSTHAKVLIHRNAKIVAERNNVAVRFSRKLFK